METGNNISPITFPFLLILTSFIEKIDRLFNFVWFWGEEGGKGGYHGGGSPFILTGVSSSCFPSLDISESFPSEEKQNRKELKTVKSERIKKRLRS